MPEPLFTSAARRHATGMARAIAPFARRIDRGCRTILARHAFPPVVRRALLAMTLAAFTRAKSLERFLKQVEVEGRRLAKHNLSPEEVRAAVFEMEAVADPVLSGRFAPSREQLRLGVRLALDRAFYQVREAEAQALFGIYQAESEATGEKDLLRRVAAVLARTFRAGAATVLLGSEADARFVRPVFVERGTPRDELIGDPAMRRRFACYWCYRLTDSAVLQLSFKGKCRWLPREKRLLEITAERCRGAVERRRLEGEIQRLEAEARGAEQEERRRIGRELHDETGQSLLLLRLQLEMLEREAPEALGARLRESRTVVENTVVELRRMIAALSPTVLERLGIVPALRHLVGQFRKLYPAEVRVDVRGQPEQMPAQIQDAVYRAAQESLQNVAKHSRASTVSISLRVTDKVFRLRVSDNGSGFEAGSAARKPKSFGLAGMRRRAALVGGTLSVKASPGKGTTVVLEVPRLAAKVAGNGENSRIVD
jgi:signal transduction histidine kinase